jgi:hypothetical protein
MSRKSSTVTLAKEILAPDKTERTDLSNFHDKKAEFKLF